MRKNIILLPNYQIHKLKLFSLLCIPIFFLSSFNAAACSASSLDVSSCVVNATSGTVTLLKVNYSNLVSNPSSAPMPGFKIDSGTTGCMKFINAAFNDRKTLTGQCGHLPVSAIQLIFQIANGETFSYEIKRKNCHSLSGGCPPVSTHAVAMGHEVYVRAMSGNKVIVNQSTNNRCEKYSHSQQHCPH